ncbi:amino acid ABC transporter permease [Paraburkholderia fungorum]|uniref:amino acid ABC transporter permease n=1 Tax=Paraburkholderia fungorum TaxID=134537 RepID=UPI0038BD5946
MHYQFDFSAVLHGDYLHWFISGTAVTLELFAVAWAGSIVLGIVLAIIRQSGLRVGAAAVAAYVEYHRNVPLVVQLLFWYFAAPSLFPASLRDYLATHGSEFPLASVALVLCAAAYVSEDLRSGFRAIPRGQLEAGRALGMSYLSTMRMVLMPQALRVSLPSLVNQALLLFKNTSLAMAIGIAELTYQAKEVDSNTFLTFEAFAVATVIYLVLSFAIMFCGSMLARRFNVAGAGR